MRIIVLNLLLLITCFNRGGRYGTASLFFVLITSFAHTIAFGQTENAGLIEQLVESMADDLPENYDYTELIDQWNHYLKHPIDLNKTSAEELRELRFLSPLQVAAIINHRELAGAYLTTYELQAVDDLDLDVVRLLLPFVVVEKNLTSAMSAKEYLGSGRHDLMLRYGRILETQRGYTIKDPTRSRYLGSADRIFTRYRYTIPQKLQVSVNMKKDAGEQFFGGAQHLGFDFYSASVYLQKVKRWQHVVIGDYSLQFGQGLALWTGVSFGKGALIQHVARQGIGLRPYTSANEFSFFRGLAATYSRKNFTLTPFVSYKKLSATFVDSVAGIARYSAIRENGLHRTPSEISNRHNLTQLLYGSNVQFQKNSFAMGANVLHMHLSGEIEPRALLYNQYAFKGSDLTNTSVYYHAYIHDVYLFGELAHSLGSGLAYTNGVIASLSRDLSLVLQYRDYQKDYHAFYNQGISEGTNAVNEQGFYTGLIFQPSKKVLWVAYADFFKFPWLRYRVDAPSAGHDLFTQLTLNPNKKVRYLLRYRFRNKAENADAEHAVVVLERVKRQQVRAEAQFQCGEKWVFRNRVEYVSYRKAANAENGHLFYQDVIYKTRGMLSGNVRLALFKTDGYNSRIYAFENDVLYAASFPFYSNKGLRYYLNLRCRIKKGIDFWCRYAASHYAGLGELGSGLDRIEGNRRSELKMQMRFQF
ncbi:helix-hairpin-helix domain-containing protein [Olivibacter sp. XZL3]|uniref:ComEA family DNA-binding protein n=1 Tax=Olivibacter sp. XZL3 TaxID=1735116 RepID=UPI0010671651|nr:helix-hairpin-helix domain-containing protein [Olivibacter sp. XZL3]